MADPPVDTRKPSPASKIPRATHGRRKRKTPATEETDTAEETEHVTERSKGTGAEPVVNSGEASEARVSKKGKTGTITTTTKGTSPTPPPTPMATTLAPLLVPTNKRGTRSDTRGGKAQASHLSPKTGSQERHWDNSPARAVVSASASASASAWSQTHESSAQVDGKDNDEAGVTRWLEADGRKLNDSVIHQLISRVLVPDAGASVAYIPSLNLENVIRKDTNGAYEITAYDGERHAVSKEACDVVRKQLSLEGVDIDKVDAVVAVVHGPSCEDELSSLYTDQGQILNPNDHWSMLLWCRKDGGAGTAYHYDSLGGLNRDRCLEAARVLRKYGVLPGNLSDVYQPNFVPVQKGGWECGYFVLLYLYLATRAGASVRPLTEAIVKSEKELIQTLDRASGTFRRLLMQKWESLSTASLYQFL